MGFGQTLFQKFKDRLDKRKQEQEDIERMRKQAEAEHLVGSEMQNHERLKEVALAQAMQKFEHAEGYKKMRAFDNVKRLEGSEVPDAGWTKKFSDYTRANREKTARRMQIHNEKMELARQLRMDRARKMQTDRYERMNRARSIRGNRRIL